MPADRVLGAVLAGGASSRFGSDKALAVIGGRTLLDGAQAMLAGVTDEVVIVGRAGGVPDVPVPGLGPLGGIAGALVHARERGFASVLTIACDMPAVPSGLLEALLAQAPSYCSDAPVLGHWPVSLAEKLMDRLSSATPSPRPRAGIHWSADSHAGGLVASWMPGQARHDGEKDGRHHRSGARSIRRWATDIGALPIPSPAPLANINTPADLARA